MSGIADVARRAGVSKSTASRALTGSGYVSADTRRRVQEAAAQLGYVASTNAVSLATGRTNTVGLIMPTTTGWFFGEVLEGVQSALIAHDLDLALYAAAPGTDARARMFDTYLGRKRFDGLITVGIEPVAEELERIAELGRPMVSIGSYDVGTSAVSINDAECARLATEHLLSLGHTDIAFLGGEPEEHSYSYGDARRVSGYIGALRAADRGASVRHVLSGVSMPAAYEAAVDLLSDARSRPTAIVAVCDEVALGVIVAARRMGIAVPTDLSVIGIDDHANSAMFSLTTLRQSPRDQASAAVRLLVDRIADPASEPKRVWAPARLVMRNSTAPRTD